MFVGSKNFKGKGDKRHVEGGKSHVRNLLTNPNTNADSATKRGTRKPNALNKKLETPQARKRRIFVS